MINLWQYLQSLSLEMSENGLLAEGIEYLFPPVPCQHFQVITGQDVQAGYLQGAWGLHRITNLSTCEPFGAVVSLKANKMHVSSFSLIVLIWSILLLNPDTLRPCKPCAKRPTRQVFHLPENPERLLLAGQFAEAERVTLLLINTINPEVQQIAGCKESTWPIMCCTRPTIQTWRKLAICKWELATAEFVCHIWMPEIA